MEFETTRLQAVLVLYNTNLEVPYFDWSIVLGREIGGSVE
jgi:hypothetical protein